MFYILYDTFIYYLHRAYQLSQANSNAKQASNMLFKFTLFPILETFRRERDSGKTNALYCQKYLCICLHTHMNWSNIPFLIHRV